MINTIIDNSAPISQNNFQIYGFTNDSETQRQQGLNNIHFIE